MNTRREFLTLTAAFSAAVAASKAAALEGGTTWAQILEEYDEVWEIEDAGRFDVHHLHVAFGAEVESLAVHFPDPKFGRGFQQIIFPKWEPEDEEEFNRQVRHIAHNGAEYGFRNLYLVQVTTPAGTHYHMGAFKGVATSKDMFWLAPSSIVFRRAT
jgi:hypothetical protein